MACSRRWRTTMLLLGLLAQTIMGLSMPPKQKWSVAVNEFGERIESVKTAVVAGVSAGVAATPIDFILHASFLPQWEFNVDQISLMGALFGLVYRYAVREDNNEQLRQGVIGAFAITRALSSVQVSSSCSWRPLNCGGFYLDFPMAYQLGSTLAESAIFFFAAAYAIDFCTEKNWLKRFPSSSL